MGASEYDPAFVSAVKRLLADEGGYSHRTRDAGGATRFGISHREYPQLDIKDLTREQATEIYWRDWWCKFRYGALPSPLSERASAMELSAMRLGEQAAASRRTERNARKMPPSDIDADREVNSEQRAVAGRRRHSKSEAPTPGAGAPMKLA